ncbi:MAG: AarF/UbiB family protein [Elusimicrobiota bacterium]
MAFDAVFDGRRRAAGPADSAAPKSAGAVKSERIKRDKNDPIVSLIKVRRSVRKDAVNILKEHLGGQIADKKLHHDVQRVLARLLKAAGLPKEAAQIHIGNSFLPNGFTTNMPSEASYLSSNASSAKAFRVAHVFLSLGLLRSVQSEARLAFVIAHELQHNWRDHLKDVTGGHQMLGHFHELEADAEGIKLAAAAGYDPRDAIDSLYDLDLEFDRLEKKYSVLKRDRNDILESLQRLKDVHPDSDMRRASMADHMDEAMESYLAAGSPKPSGKTPVWMIRRDSAERPTTLERFEKRLNTALARPTMIDRLMALEGFVEALDDSLTAEHFAIIEEAYGALIDEARTLDELRPIGVSMRRSVRLGFPSARLMKRMLRRQVETVLKDLPERPTMTDLRMYRMPLDETVKRETALQILDQAKSRDELEAAFRSLTLEAENLGFNLEKVADEEAQKTLIDQVARRLWKSTRKVLEKESRAPPAPEAIIAEIRAKLSPAWLKGYRVGFDLQIIESAFGPEKFRSQTYRPSQLAALLKDGSLNRWKAEQPWLRKSFDGMDRWAQYHYTDIEVDLKGTGDVVYHRYYLKGLTSPSPEDRLDLARHFLDTATVPPAMVQLLRQEGRLHESLTAMIRDLGEVLRGKLAEGLLPHGKDVVLSEYVWRVGNLLDSALYQVRDLAETREVAATAWAEVSKLLKDPKVEEGFKEQEKTRTKLSEKFLNSVSAAVRRAVAARDHAGLGPDGTEIGRLSKLVREIDSTLRKMDGYQRVLGHARNLAALAGRKADYMAAYEDALPIAVEPPGFFATIGIWLRWRLRLAPWAKRMDEQPLTNQDFVHFLALIGDPKVDAETKVMAAALLDNFDTKSYSTSVDPVKEPLKAAEQADTYLAASLVGRWLLLEAAEKADDAASLRSITKDLLWIRDLHPGFLHPDAKTKGTLRHGFRKGGNFLLRNEPYRSLIKQEHPFRGLSVRWALMLMDRLDARKAWPDKVEDRLRLLDMMNATGEFNDRIERRILKTAHEDRAGFLRWKKQDERWLQRMRGKDNKDLTVPTPAGPVPMPMAAPLRIVRNPHLRARLFSLLPESKLSEQPRFGAWARLRGFWRLAMAYRHARAFFSREFLDGLQREGSLERKFFDALEAADRLSEKATEEALARWDKGKFTRDDKGVMWSHFKDRRWTKRWPGMLAHEKAEAASHYKHLTTTRALMALERLYTAFVSTQEPVLNVLLKNYPEPTRSRDELLEGVLKARRLTPGAIAALEAHKSYRAPNPVRKMEKDFQDVALVQMRRFTPAERVDILLHVLDAQPLTPAKERAFNERILSGDRKRLARDRGSIRSIGQLKNYLSLLHPVDRAAMVRAQFYGSHVGSQSARKGGRFVPLSEAPEEVERLFEKLVIEGRDLPPFLQKLFRIHFRILTMDERARLISGMGAFEDMARDMSGPEAVKVALKGMGVTGAKTAQVLATHKGVLPEEYAEALDGFKDRAQEMRKTRAHDLMSEKLTRIVRSKDGLATRKPRMLQEMLEAAKVALPKESESMRQRLAREVRYLLAEQGARVTAIEKVGPELGSGSIKVVYKVYLDDGRIWVAKVRAPGASYRIGREFEIIKTLIDKLEASGDLDMPGTRQLLDEVKSLVQAEMDFRDEAEKERAMRKRVVERPWYAKLLFASPHIPNAHPAYVGEDLFIEEFVPSRRFADLPLRSLIGPSKRVIARRTVAEASYALIVDEWNEPDPHTGNRSARSKGILDRIRTKLVVIDLGQGAHSPIKRLLPIMKAGLALESDDPAGAARHLVSIVNIPAKHTAESIAAAAERGLAKRPEAGTIERMMDGLIEAEKEGAIVKPEFSALQKNFVIMAGYSPWLPKNYVLRATERAMMVRLWRDAPVSRWKLARLGLKRMLFGTAAVRADLERVLDTL